MTIGIDGRRRATDLVYQHLQELIVQGELHPGQRLDLDELSETLKVSRTPVREAVLKLETEGLVVRRPYRGVVVSALDPQDIADVYGVRIALEDLAARVAASRLTDADLRVMEVEHEAMLAGAANESRPDYDAFSAHNAAFHDVVYRATGSEELHAYLTVLGTKCDRMRRHFDISNNPKVHEEHGAILDACRERDEAKLVAATREHVFHTCAILLAEVAPDMELPPVLASVLNEVERATLEVRSRP